MAEREKGRIMLPLADSSLGGVETLTPDGKDAFPSTTGFLVMVLGGSLASLLMSRSLKKGDPEAAVRVFNCVSLFTVAGVLAIDGSRQVNRLMNSLRIRLK